MGAANRELKVQSDCTGRETLLQLSGLPPFVPLDFRKQTVEPGL